MTSRIRGQELLEGWTTKAARSRSRIVVGGQEIPRGKGVWCGVSHQALEAMGKVADRTRSFRLEERVEAKAAWGDCQEKSGGDSAWKPGASGGQQASFTS